MNDQSPMIHIVDGARGIYTYANLVERFPLYNDQGILYSPKDLEFHPDNEFWCENIDWAESNGLHVKDMAGRFWRVESIDGDLFAIHPDAVWSDEEDNYVFEKSGLTLGAK